MTMLSGCSSTPNPAEQKPALITAKITKGKITDSRVSGFRAIGYSEKATILDQAHLGSNTKAMTAYLVALSINEKRLNWTSKVSSFFPEIKFHPSHQNLTLEHLLTHRSGLVSVFSIPKVWKQIWELGNDVTSGRKLIAESVLTQKATFETNSKYEYNNDNYRLLGFILEKIYHQKWEKIIQEKLFSPLKMTSCGIGPVDLSHPGSPQGLWGHQEINGKLVPVRPSLYADNPPSSSPSGRVHCSVIDWAKFIALTIDTYHLRNKQLSREISQKLFQTVTPDSDYTYGGWSKVERRWGKGPVFTHSGSNTLNHSVAWVAPEIETAFIGVTNAGTDQSYEELDKSIGELN